MDGDGCAAKFRGNLRSETIIRLKTTAWGGTPLDDDEAQELLRGAGLDAVRSLPTPPGVLGLTVGCRPPDGP